MPKRRGGATYLTVSELAKVLDVHRNTVIYWIEQDMIKYERMGAAPKSPFLIPMDEVKRLTHSNGADTK